MNRLVRIVVAMLFICVTSGFAVADSKKVLVTLHNYQTDQQETVDVLRITDAKARELIPQHPIAQRLYQSHRTKGNTIVASMLVALEASLAIAESIATMDRNAHN